MMETLVVRGLGSFAGKHCETTALKRVLSYHGLSLSEEMLLGLGGGIGFIYWYMKRMPSPFVGGRSGKNTDFSTNICRRIGAEVTIVETSGSKRGYEELKTLLRDDEPAVVYGDMAYLPYFALPEKVHFGGHVFVVFGLDEARDEVYIYDRGVNPVTVRIADLARARSSKFLPFPPRHRLLKIKYPARIENLEKGIKASISECCRNMLKPPIKNLGLAGMEKWAKEVIKWPDQFQGMDLLGALMNGFIYIETGGTGGSAFRLMYAEFLEEASAVLSQPVLKEVAEMMRKSAVVWSDIASGYMPDSCSCLQRIRELTVEGNELFQKQAPDGLEAMRKINEEVDNLMEQAAEDLKKAPEFLYDVQQNILECLQIEDRAFKTLSSII
ncbi:BtrH N-terminal domain-containing protein [Chloroflexota bacterium]